MARCLSGLHFVVNEPWYAYVGPCLDAILKRLVEDPGDVVTGSWCAARHDYLDEHALWVASRLCGFNPGPRIDETDFDINRPLHGMHVHGRPFATDADRRYWCSRVAPIVGELPNEIAGPRYRQQTGIASCRKSR